MTRPLQRRLKLAEKTMMVARMRKNSSRNTVHPEYRQAGQTRNREFSRYRR
jgi:hypothetical protein